MTQPLALCWSPSPRVIAEANVTRLMRKLGFAVNPADPAAVAREARRFVRRTQDNIEWFWENALGDLGVEWHRPYERLLDLSKGPEWADWFLGGELNLVQNCLDRHAAGPLCGQTALIAETEDGAVRTFTFGELSAEVSRVAGGLRALGVRRGDTVAAYMPMVAEVAIAMLAVQKIGAIFIPVFSGYAPPAVRERLVDAGVKVLFTADGGLRRGRAFPLKAQADEAVGGLPALRHVVVYRRLAKGIEAPMRPGRDVFWDDLVRGQAADAPTEPMPAMAPALVIYTSGTTGKPKGTVHTHAGCIAQMAKELGYHFDLKRSDRFFWLTDIGWMMGPWEITGCLFHGAPFLVFEGAPDYPGPDRVWSLVEKHGLTQLGLSPTAVRLLIRQGGGEVENHPMETLRILGSTGEPWDPESYVWYFEKVGKRRCPVINISGGTDIVGCFLAPLPILPLKPTSLGTPGLGMDIDAFSEEGKPLVGEVGYLVCKKPAPSMTRGLWKDPEKYLETYWRKFPGIWNHGDWARVDQDGDWFLYGRADDTLKIAGRRVGPGEIEAALIEDEAVSEAAAVGVPDPLKGQEVVCFVVLKKGFAESEELRARLIERVVKALGKVDRPRAVYFASDLPKTRSAKILRRLIQKRFLGETQLGDLSSVANPEALEGIARAR